MKSKIIESVKRSSCLNTNRKEIQPVLFGPSDKQLFGCYHFPKSNMSRNCGVILCNSIGDEYIRFHRAYRQLADLLSRSGFPVLRFDYYGCGDSSGECNQGTVEQWLYDVESACTEMRHRSGVRRICLAGLRIGGTLATLAGVATLDIDGIVLWDPVLNGNEYVHQLMTMHNGMLRYAHVQHRPETVDDHYTEILGFRFSNNFLKSIRNINLMEMKDTPCDKLLLIETDRRVCQSEFGNRVTKLGANLNYQRFPNEELWVWQEEMGKIRVPHQVLHSIVSWSKELFQ